jgi:hypothetical protein
MREEVVLAKTDQRDGLTRVIVEYVTLNLYDKLILSLGFIPSDYKLPFQ